MFLLIGIIVILFVVFGTVILAQNGSQLITLHFLGRSVENISVSLVIIESVVVGAIFAFIIMVINEIKLRKILRGKEKEIKGLKEELGAIRNLPLEEEENELEKEE
ncbi:LapA family protein [candidate division WOR-3 bacterium]|nr:LapA family protein [candidate division WOR-3 bacterium]